MVNTSGKKRMPLCLVIGLTFYVIWTWLLIPPDPDAFPGYDAAVLLLVVAVLIEMMAEPMHIYSQIRCQFTIRIIAETSGLLVRCVLLLAFVTFSPGDNGSSGSIRANGSASKSDKSILIAFAVSQVLASICYSLIFGIHFAKQPDGDCDLRQFIPTLDAVSRIAITSSSLLFISLFSSFILLHCYYSACSFQCLSISLCVFEFIPGCNFRVYLKLLS